MTIQFDKKALAASDKAWDEYAKSDDVNENACALAARAMVAVIGVKPEYEARKLYLSRYRVPVPADAPADAQTKYNREKKRCTRAISHAVEHLGFIVLDAAGKVANKGTKKGAKAIKPEKGAKSGVTVPENLTQDDLSRLAVIKTVPEAYANFCQLFAEVKAMALKGAKA